MTTYLLIAQNSEAYEPIAEVTDSEAEEFARADMRGRRPENDDMCPEEYALWHRNRDGRYTVARIIRL